MPRQSIQFPWWRRCLTVVALVSGLSGCSEKSVTSLSTAETQEGVIAQVPKESNSGSPALAARTSKIRVATYNINYGNRQLNAVAEAIRRADADVVCLQETNVESENYLRQEFSNTYSYIRFQGDVSNRPAGWLRTIVSTANHSRDLDSSGPWYVSGFL